MRTISLCSGIGGWELALPFTETVVLSEINKPASKVLETRFPGIPNHGDFTQWESFDVYKPDLIVGGLPCQPVSTNGYRRGAEDKRWLYDIFIDILKAGEYRPVIAFENVPNITNFSELYTFYESLESLGYKINTIVLPAFTVGAPHFRYRWFMLAYDGDLPPLTGAVSKPQHPHNKLISTITRNSRGHMDHLADFTIKKKHLNEVRILSEGLTKKNPYYNALRHWEDVLSQEMPNPVVEGRMSKEFKEWVMGFPVKWTAAENTSEVAHTSLTGNAMVPLQAAYAWDRLVNERKVFRELLDLFK